jgi:hypothetical protein
MTRRGFEFWPRAFTRDGLSAHPSRMSPWQAMFRSSAFGTGTAPEDFQGRSLMKMCGDAYL